MNTRLSLGAILASISALVAFQAPGKPDAEFAALVGAYLKSSLGDDWESLDKLPGTRWSPLPATSLQNCLPDGGCYSRQGVATIGGRNLTLVATGARTIVSNLYLRNPAAPIGEAAITGALSGAGITAGLARCPIPGGAGGTNWYRLSGQGLKPAHLSIQTRCNGKACEGFVLTPGEKLPKLQPSQLALYSEQCAAGVARTPVSTARPHELIAETIRLLLAGAAGTGFDWKALATLVPDITWAGEGPRPTDLTSQSDPNPVSRSGSLSLAGREFSVLASGTPTQVKTVYLEEIGLHPKGEHMLGVLYQKGFAVQLVRCGPVYTESTNNWYTATSSKTRPAMVLQSIRYDGNQVQDSYAIRLDGTLPNRDPRDRNPGVNGC